MFRLIVFSLEAVDTMRPEKRKFLFPRSNCSNSAPVPGEQPLAAQPKFEEILRMGPAQIEVNGSIHPHLHAFRQASGHGLSAAADQHNLSDQRHLCSNRKLRRFRIWD